MEMKVKKKLDRSSGQRIVQQSIDYNESLSLSLPVWYVRTSSQRSERYNREK